MSTLKKPSKKRESRSMAFRIDRLASTPSLVPPPYFRWKGAMGRVLAAILLIPGIPIIGLSILAVRLTSRGRGIYRQTRVGKDGQLFEILKIRTMREDAEAETGPVWPNEHDPRRTRVGSFLRKCHIDEIPQLLNVLRGDMCLIGPRPERPEFVEVLAEKIPRYVDRLAVLPGITGLAQINLPPDSDLDSVRRKLALDLKYIEEASPWLDVRMLVWSFLRLALLPGEWLTSLLWLRREVPEFANAPHQALQKANGTASRFAARAPGGMGASPAAIRANGNGAVGKRNGEGQRNRRRARPTRKPR